MSQYHFFWGLVLRLLHGEGDTVKELRSCQAQVTPSVPLPLSVFLSVVMGGCVCVSSSPRYLLLLCGCRAVCV